MALNNYQQAHNLLGKSKNILIIAGHEEIEDTYPASLGLGRALKANKKQVSILSKGELPDNLLFLGGEDLIQKNIPTTQDIIVSVDVSQKPIKKISYKKNDSRLNIHITAEENVNLEENDIHVKRGAFRYDLIVAVGLADLESLGEEFSKNTSFFFDIPIINIDKNSSNERYGEINIIELTSSSCSEILSNILNEWNGSIIKKDSATCLLCGVIASTNNFQSRTTPGTLFASATLMSREADQQEIIKNIFKTKSFELLKIWGSAMTKLQFNKNKNLGWLTLTRDDFKEANSSPKSIPLILKELRNNFSEAGIFLIFWENDTTYCGIANSAHKELLDMLSEKLKGQQKGNNLLFILPSKDKIGRENALQIAVRTLDRIGI